MTPEDKKKLEQQIDNWSRWARSIGSPRGRCASIEGRYVAPKLSEEDSIERSEVQAIIPMDILGAETVEQAVQAMQVDLQRQCLVLWHLGQRRKVGEAYRRLTQKQIATELLVSLQSLSTLHQLALVELAYQLRLLERRNRLSAVKYRSVESGTRNTAIG